MSNKLRYSLIGIIVLLIVGLLHQCNKPKVTNNGQVSLKPNQKEQVSYNPVTHTIIDIKDNGTVTKDYGRNPTVTVNKNGTVQVDRHDWGFEHEPFIGIAQHDTPRVHVGCSLFYYNRWDLNLSLALTTRSTYDTLDFVSPTLSLSYNIISNTNVFVGIDSHKSPCVGVFLRW